eukprot:11468146-Karenia_brevis.AAC.1
MAQDVTDVLVAAGMVWKPSSLEVLTTALGAETFEFYLWQSGQPLPVKQVTEMEVLGCKLSSTGDVLVPVRHRLAKATA